MKQEHMKQYHYAPLIKQYLLKKYPDKFREFSQTHPQDFHDEVVSGLDKAVLDGYLSAETDKHGNWRISDGFTYVAEVVKEYVEDYLAGIVCL